MKKQNPEQKIEYEINEFAEHCHLWNIVPGGSGKGLVLLRSIVDSIQNEKRNEKLPSILLLGRNNTGKNLIAKSLVNSLAIEDVRQCHGRYFENGINSTLFFRDSQFDTAHIITNIENIRVAAESVIWRYLHDGCCNYFNYATREYDKIKFCYGMIILTARNKSKVSKAIIDTVDYLIDLEPYTQEQSKLIVHQILSCFCKINYIGGETLLQAIVNQGAGMIGLVIDFLKTCIMVKKSKLLDNFDMDLVNRAKGIWMNTVAPPPPPHNHIDDIPF